MSCPSFYGSFGHPVYTRIKQTAHIISQVFEKDMPQQAYQPNASYTQPQSCAFCRTSQNIEDTITNYQTFICTL